MLHFITLFLLNSQEPSCCQQPRIQLSIQSPTTDTSPGSHCARLSHLPHFFCKQNLHTESKSYWVHYLALRVLQAHFVLRVISSANLLRHSKQWASSSPSHRKQADSFFHRLYFPLHKNQMLRSRINHKKGRLVFKHLRKHVCNPHALVKPFLSFKQWT